MTRTSRTVAAVLAASAVAGAATALVLARGGEAATPPAFRPVAHSHHQTHPTSAKPTAAEAAFSAEMRRLWFEHVEWTRLAIVDFAAGSPALDASLARLLRNQTDIGNAIAPFYGKAAGRKLTALLREHILIAVEVLKAAKAGDTAALNRAQARWNGNADRISAFLAAANPEHWPLAAVRSMMRAHLALTTKEAVARLQGRWKADVAAADEVEHAMMHMADALTAGVVAQFPRRFGRPA
jgi:hypothetical protein